MKNSIQNKFWWAAKSFAAVAVLGISVANLSADTLTITWTGTIGELEDAIMNDNYAHDVYLLEANRVYLQRETIVLESSCHIVGAAYGDGEHPATIQPILGSDGASQFTGWPAGNIKTYGEDQSYEFKNLLFNGAFADGSTTLFGVLATYGARNSILVDHVTSVHNEVITYFCFGQEERWTLTNNTAVQYSSYPAGMWFGGFWWGGGGGWTGTVESLLIQNNTIEGTYGQTMVIYDNGLVNRTGSEMIHIDHNTFVNSILETKYYRHGNNTHFTNNLFINQMSGGQTRNAYNTNIALNNDLENGHGKTVTLYQGACSDSTLLADGNCWDNTNRNIHYNNNAWFDTPELLDMFAMDPWCWERTEYIYDEYGYEIDQVTVEVCDTMIANQSKWLGDSTIAQFVNNVSESNNIHAADLGWNLDPAYTNAQIGRTEDWLDNGVHDTHTDHFWMHQADGDNISVQWPLPLDFSYSATSAAATHCTHGGPLGSTHHMDHVGTLLDPDAGDGLFISEYSEGGTGFGSDKYLEIYNGTDAEVDLSGYAFPSVSNAPDDPGVYEFWNSFTAGATIAPGDVYVIAHPDANEDIAAHADQTYNYLSNGDDGHCLVAGTEENYTIIDCLGDWNGDPGSGWDVAGVNNATKDHTLIRKSSVTNGNPDWPSSAGTDADNSEWVVINFEDHSGLGSHTMTAPTMVTFWLDAYDVPCDGSPYLAGSFNGWNATDIEMTYDEEWDEYYADVYLMPGYYEYKFTCFDWSASENIPAECYTPDGNSNRYVEVPELDGEDWYEVDVVGWGECPEPDPCDLLDCSNLHFAGVMESGLINHIADTLGFTADSVESMIYLGAVTMGVYSTWGIDTATFMPEFSDPEYSNFLYVAEYPYGIPDTSEYYYWWWAVDAYGLFGDEFGDLQEYGLGEECTFAYENYDEYNDSTYTINVRYWDPSLWEEELYMLAMGDDDVDPYDVWNVDLYGSCEFWFDDSDDDMTYIGNFQGHEYYAVDNFLTWYEANLEAQNAGGYLATITSPEENDFVRSSIESQGLYDAHWFGLIDIMSDGTGWSWFNGEPLSYTNWAAGEPNGQGQENCGEFYSYGEWNDTHCDGMLPFVVEFGDVEEPEEPTITSYTYQVQTLDSYNNGDYATTVLPNVDVNDGLHTIATFDTAGIEGPYAGLYTLFFDSNFNGQLDSTDFNMLSWSDFGNDENVLLLVDNGPNDMNPDVGVYETITHHDSDEGGFIRVQGANYFMIALSPDYTINGYTAVTPVSGSTNRVTGTGTMPDPDTGELVGVPNMWVSMWNWNDGNLVGMGITGPDGSYDIGVDINDSTEVWISVDENYNMTDRYVGLFENGGWYGYGGTWIQATLGPDGTVQDFDVIMLNTLVHGQVTAPDGSPAAYVGVNIEWTYAGDYYGYYNSSLWSYTETDEYGYYSFWGMNGESVNISIWSQHEDYYEEVNIFSETYDEYIGGYYFNYDIMLMDPPDLPQTELLDNNSFEDYYYDYYTGNNHAVQWSNFPWDDNFHVAQTGEGIYGSEETFTALDGEASLKMLGQYNDDGADNTTDYYQFFYQQIDPGAVINAGAMMMSHPGDWIGGGSGLNNGQVFVSYFDEYWNFLGMDVSEPMDTSYAAGEWHHMSVIGEVPDGATNVNIGVRYNQVYGSDGSEGHGSIYYDNVQAYTSASDVHTVQINGMTEQDEFDEYGEHIGSAPLPNAPIYVWNENYFIEVMSDDYGWWFAEVPVNQLYYVTGGYVDGFYESSFEEVFACDGYYYYDYDEYCYYDDYYGYEYCYDDYYDYCDNQANIHFTQNDAMWFEVQGQVTDASGNAVYDAQVRLENHDTGQNYWTGTDYMGYFSVDVPYGMYDAHAGGLNGYMLTHEYGVEVMSQGIFLSLTLEAAEFTGAVEGLVIFHGNPPENPANLWMWSDDYAGGGAANEDGFYSIPLPDGIYNIWISAPNYEGFYQENAFEIAGNTVMFNVELYEHGFAGAPQIVDLHDIPNDQGRQMRSVWSPGIPGNWEYFTQYSIWRKVNGAPVELWDYVETVPWHGVDEPYAAVVPTLGDSSVHGIYESTFMVTAHTEDINIWFDSQPISGYSIDNLHPGTPMSLVYSHDPGAVSLSWSGPEDEDFSHHNIYRQDIVSSDPAIVFTTVDSFYVDQEVTDVGAYQYWVTAVDLSGLESEASNSVSAVLSADENLGLPTEFALKQNYPNPFNPSTQIQYALPEETRVVISIYDLIGRKVRTLVNDVQDAGYRTVIWNSTNDMGRLVSAGVYIYSIQAGDFVQNRKMVLMK